MGEYVQALRAIWRCWEKVAPLNFKGEHYNFTLMTPAFSPPPTGLPMVPVTIAAVGPAMLRLASRHCDGSGRDNAPKFGGGRACDWRSARMVSPAMPWAG
jgi:alkanesulfonate monooxygenase SsuD/methylene tetrahydromethanopterin reductase-like flavin-dependent oxidoreductase (luciferase family)